MNYILPIAAAAVFIMAIIKKVDIPAAFAEGVYSGAKTLYSILPSLILMLTAVFMFRSAGGIDLLVYALTPVLSAAGIPPEVIPLAMIKPFSGSGATAVFDETVRSYGADSRIGRIAAVMCASTETTFYTLSVYLSKTLKSCGKIVLCALLADCAAVVLASLTVTLIG